MQCWRHGQAAPESSRANVIARVNHLLACLASQGHPSTKRKYNRPRYWLMELHVTSQRSNLAHPRRKCIRGMQLQVASETCAFHRNCPQPDSDLTFLSSFPAPSIYRRYTSYQKRKTAPAPTSLHTLLSCFCSNHITQYQETPYGSVQHGHVLEFHFFSLCKVN